MNMVILRRYWFVAVLGAGTVAAYVSNMLVIYFTTIFVVAVVLSVIDYKKRTRKE